jgi:ribosomal protein S12 methylthiotransferase
MIKLGVITLGCPKNTADTESLLSKLTDGTSFVNIDDAEIVLLNTCAFLKTARDEVFEKLKNLKSKKVILLGCMAGLLKEDEFKKYPQLFAIVSGIHYPNIAKIISSVAEGKKIYAVTPEPLKFVEMDGKLTITPLSYAYIKIAEGCDNACSFCLIPSLKGKYRSRKFEDVIKEAEKLIKSGVKEIILVAQDSGYYGMDLYGKKRLADLLTKISAIKGDFWVRVLYIYPERIDDELIKTIAENPKICKYFDTPLQHGDTDILKAMYRPFDIEKTIQKIKKIRTAIPNAAFRTSLIAGFPGETEKAFNNLLKFIEEIRFDNVGVFEYSREEGTKAYDLKNQVPAKIKKARRAKAMILQQKISYAINKKSVGSTQRVLIERYDGNKKIYFGRSMRFAPEIDGQVIITSKSPLKLNQFYDVIIEKAEPYDLIGEIYENQPKTSAAAG